MSRSVVYLSGPRRRRGNWASEDLAQFRRAAGILRHLGLSIDIDNGMTDEGDPWFVFCHADSGDVLAHCARINGIYVVCAPCLKASLQGLVLPALLERLLQGLVPWPRHVGAAPPPHLLVPERPPRHFEGKRH
jgi:hypothetical protein